MPKVLALDFDGVISDSALEAYLITWQIAGKVDFHLATGSNGIPGLEDIRLFRDNNRNHWNSFVELIPFGNRAEDYLVIQRAVHFGLSFSTQEEFTSFRNGIEPSLLDKFHEEFYRVRYAFMEHYFDRWLELNHPYPGIREALQILSERFELAVATSKDTRAVVTLLKGYGIGHLFGSGHVLDKSMGASKKAHLAKICQLFNCTYSDISFIDDKVAHLIDCSGLGVKRYLAAWGYNGEQERNIALKHGIPVLELTDIDTI